MAKVQFGPRRMMYPRPIFLIGANVDGKANFMAAGSGGVANGEPPMICIPVGHGRYTHKGITQNMTFSVNLVPENLAKEADYCGLVSGRDADKVKVTGFKVFYGKIETAPMIEQCPMNIECRVTHVLDLGSHSLFIGQIVETHVSDDCLTEGKPDIQKMKALAYSVDPNYFLSTTQVVARAYSIGNELKEKK